MLPRARWELGGWLLVAVGAWLMVASTSESGASMLPPLPAWAKRASSAVSSMWEDVEESAEAGREVSATPATEEERLHAEQMEMLRAITEHCLPKLVCELFSKQFKSSLTEAELNLMSLIGVTSLNPSGPSKYHFAAHMGQLIRGVEGGGCHHFYPFCPFTGDDVRHIAKKIKIG